MTWKKKSKLNHGGALEQILLKHLKTNYFVLNDEEAKKHAQEYKHIINEE